jgi:hypothetical protein
VRADVFGAPGASVSNKTKPAQVGKKSQGAASEKTEQRKPAAEAAACDGAGDGGGGGGGAGGGKKTFYPCAICKGAAVDDHRFQNCPLAAKLSALVTKEYAEGSLFVSSIDSSLFISLGPPLPTV